MEAQNDSLLLFLDKNGSHLKINKAYFNWSDLILWRRVTALNYFMNKNCSKGQDAAKVLEGNPHTERLEGWSHH